ncbi:MAG: hypothetical protein E6G56_09195 [Actinobacteria bacterium]|nr:MAG: hypothetical protein E6G56_09195 [Actinomycetota bacterium]
MEIVLSTSSLEALGGSETYVITIGDHLQRLGHEVWLHALDHGTGSAMARQLGLRVCRNDRELPERPDALIVQDGVVAYQMAVRYPRVPQVFVALSDLFDLQLPPQLPEVVAVVVALYDRVERRLRALALPQEIVRLTQPVDVERFKPTRPLRKRPLVALAMSNYLHGQRMALLTSACEERGIQLLQVGAFAPAGERPSVLVLNEADIVFGKARVIYEAMACGRAAYVFDHNGGDGWVTASSFATLSADNFGGQSRADVTDRERLIVDLAAYDPGMGTVNRDLVVTHNSATKHVAELVRILHQVSPRRAHVGGPLRELARLVRVAHRADGRAFILHAETERLAARVHELEDELASARGAAAQAWHALSELTATRRWRLVQAALRPADRLRGRGRRQGKRPQRGSTHPPRRFGRRAA